MTSQEIKQLLDQGLIQGNCDKPELIETHISWVILCDSLAYKIKKPIQYSFLDFSSINKRLFYCQEEIRLNWRLTFNVYLSIAAIRKHDDKIVLGGSEGEIIDYAVCMRRLDSKRQMNRLILRNHVNNHDIQNIALLLARFHQHTKVIKQKEFDGLQEKFNDLVNEKNYVSEMIDPDLSFLIDKSMATAENFILENKELMQDRLEQGFYRDGHGDLHTRNIFLLDQPVIFDCIEFNADYREIDILNEIAFLCMDLEAAGHDDLSALFLKYYVKQLNLKLGAQEKALFTFYKSYRANVSAKVNCLRAQSTTHDADCTKALNEVKKYLHLMDTYLEHIDDVQFINH